MRKQTTIRLPDALKAKVIEEAENMGVSVNEFVIMILNRFLESELPRVLSRTQKYNGQR